MKPSTRTPRVRGHASREVAAPQPKAAAGSARRKAARAHAHTNAGDKAPRARRTAPEARKRILEAAQRELLRVGPEALRLTDLARQLQVSHPAILHHFGSREGLVAAVVRHSMEQLTQQLMATLKAATTKRIGRFEVVEMVANVCREDGLARLLAFLLLESRDGRGREAQSEQMPLKPLVDATHELRRRFAHPASYADTRFEVQLIAIVLLGDAIFGDAVRRATGLRDDAAATDFRRRLTQLLPR